MSEAIVPPVRINGKDARVAELSAQLAEALGDDFKPPAAPMPRLAAVELSALIDMDIPEPQMMAGGLLKEGTLAMAHAGAGVGKTYLVSIGLGVHLSHGVDFLGWNIPKPVSVALIDGEMSAHELQKRFKSIADPIRNTWKGTTPWAQFHIVTPDLLPAPIRKIDTPEGQMDVLALVDSIPDLKVLILDNLSALTAPDDDNSAASWSPIQDLLLMLRRRGIAVILIHHSGKGGAQRGTSRRADILDVILKIESDPEHILDNDGKTHVVVTFEKARSMSGGQRVPFTAVLQGTPAGDGLVWTRAAGTRPLGEQIRALLLLGMSCGEIQNELKTTRSYVYRVKDEIKDELAEVQERKRAPKRRGNVVPLRGDSE